jgi:hypothetical protein
MASVFKVILICAVGQPFYRRQISPGTKIISGPTNHDYSDRFIIFDRFKRILKRGDQPFIKSIPLLGAV